MSNVVCRMSYVECRMSNVECRISNVGCRISDVGYRISDVRHWMPDVGCLMSDVGCRISDVRCWFWMWDIKCRMSDGTYKLPYVCGRCFDDITFCASKLRGFFLSSPVAMNFSRRSPEKFRWKIFAGEDFQPLVVLVVLGHLHGKLLVIHRS